MDTYKVRIPSYIFEPSHEILPWDYRNRYLRTSRFRFVASAQITERTFYPNLIKIIKAKGGSGVSEVKYNSEPDIVFELSDRKWLLGIKIGETPAILKSSFIQYHRHKDESGIKQGLLLFLPENARKIKPDEAVIDRALGTKIVDCLVDTPLVKEDYGDSTFPEVIDRLKTEVIPKIHRKEAKAYSVNLIVKFLTEQIEELMGQIPVNDPAILKAIIDQNLLSGIGNLDRKHAKVATQFLGASILLSQLMFLRLYGVAHSAILPSKPVTRSSVRAAFKRIADINYRPIYGFDVIDSVSEEYLRETYDLISGLEIEQSRFELPGRIFHALMPKNIRKLMAAFYTRPQSADILTQLSVNKWTDTVLDPACGSGTILVSAYRKKAELQQEARIDRNTHKQFCEKEIFGADIMPFAVHLTTANLAAMDPATTIKKTQIIQGDSLDLSLGDTRAGYQQRLFRPIAKGKDMNGEEYEVTLERMDSVLMNPPFTKVERGIRKFVNMSRYNADVGGDASLWTHFIMLANEFLKDRGTYGAVLPVSVLRGHETEKVRRFLFTKMTPLYIVKATLNYGFSESSEYRDVLFIARKAPPPPEHRVKFCLIKHDVNSTTWDQARYIAEQLRTVDRSRAKDFDIESFTMAELLTKKSLMSYIGVIDYSHRDLFLSFIRNAGNQLRSFPKEYVKEGIRSEGKAARAIFFTRGTPPSRLDEAFLGFTQENAKSIKAVSKRGVQYDVEKISLSPSLRTGVGLDRMNIEGMWDYVAHGRYDEFPQVVRATGIRAPDGKPWAKFFTSSRKNIQDLRTHLVVSLRLNPFSPNVHLISFFSETPISPSDQFKVLREENVDKAKAVCIMLNSAIFLTNLFLSKEETTGRFIHIRTHDLQEIKAIPEATIVEPLVKVFDKYSRRAFPALHEQMDMNFLTHYQAFQTTKDWSTVNFNLQPSTLRLDLDQEVLRALGSNVTKGELLEIYQAIEKEMIVTRGLTRD